MKRSAAQTAEYYNSLPRKRTAASVLIFDTRGRMLVVKPTYLDRWLWPGGGIEADEAPSVAAHRECLEEIGFDPPVLQPAFVDYQKAREGQADQVLFVFVAEPVATDFAEHLNLQAEEISEARFIVPAEAENYLSARRSMALRSYQKSSKQGCLYLENGSPIVTD